MNRKISEAMIFCALWMALALTDHAATEKPIRVGIIRCDFHGMYYAPLMGQHDPAKLQNPMRGTEGKNYYSWQGGGSHFAFYRNYADRMQMTIPRVEGFVIVKLWDEHRDAAEAAASIFYSRPKVCDSFEEVSDGVDLVLIGDCNYDGSDHLKLASPGLKKGVPTFLDKPFAHTYGDARKLVELSRQSGAPLLSLSILRELPLARLFRDRFGEIEPVRFGVIRGGGLTLAGQIHAVALSQLLFGFGVRTIECMGQTPLGYIHLGYGGAEGKPDDGVMLLCASGRTSADSQFFASAYSEKGGIHSPALNWYTFPYGAVEIVKLMKRMVLERKSPVPPEEMLELIAIVDAARISQKEKRQVRIEEITGESRGGT
jgi:predicted dehydrogenase